MRLKNNLLKRYTHLFPALLLALEVSASYTIEFNDNASDTSTHTLTLNTSSGELVSSNADFAPTTSGALTDPSTGNIVITITGVSNNSAANPFVGDTWSGGDPNGIIKSQTQGMGIGGDVNNNVQSGEAFLVTFDTSALPSGYELILSSLGFNVEYFEVYERNYGITIGTTGAGSKVSGSPSNSYSLNKKINNEAQFSIISTLGSNGPRWTSIQLDLVCVNIPPKITHMALVEDFTMMEFTWNSSFGQQFNILRSENLTDWTIVNENLPASIDSETSHAVELSTETQGEFYKIQLNRERIPKPNIILLFADDLGYGDLACYGHPYAVTPNLDRLASQGTLFRKFNVTGATCNPSRTGILTSWLPEAYPLSTAQFGFNQAQHGHFNRVTVMELLKTVGYTTGLVGKWHIGPDEEIETGIYGLDYIALRGGGGNNTRGRDEEIYELAIEFIEANQNVPFYLNVMGRVTHAPVNPRADLVELAGFDDLVITRDAFQGQQIQDNFNIIESANVGDQNISSSMANYLTEVYFLDQYIGELLDKLDELGIADNTIVMFSSDQGAAPVDDDSAAKTNLVGYSGGLRGQKHTQYEGGIRSPCILRWPGYVPEGKVNTESTISALDWLPTLCRIVDIPLDGYEFHGEDILDIWMGANRSRTQPQFWRQSMKYLDGNHEWRIYFQGGGTTAIELYDLVTDIAETNNLLDSRPDVVTELTAIWSDWKAGLP